MNLSVNERYKTTLLQPEVLQMIIEMIIDKEPMIKVIEIIKKNTYHPTKNSDVNGISKKNIMKQVKVFTKKKDKTSNTFVDSENNLSRNMCDNIMSFLTGGTLVFSKENHREDLYQLTIRGLQVAKELENKGYIK